MPCPSPSFTSEGVGAHINYSVSNFILIDKTAGRAIRRVVSILVIYKEVYQIDRIERSCNYLFVYIYCILSIYMVTYGSRIFSVNYMCIIIIERK